LKELTCGRCGCRFSAARKRKFCHEPCGKPKPEPNRSCKECNAPLKGRGRGSGTVVCSEECRKARAEKRKLSQRVPDHLKKCKGSRCSRCRRVSCKCVKVTCIECSAVFMRQEINSKFGLRQRCDGCQAAFRRRRQRSGLKKIVCVCGYCGSMLIRSEYQAIGKAAFCDSECYLNFRSSFNFKPISIKSESLSCEGTKCEFCKKPVAKTRDISRRFCSQHCCQSAHKKLRLIKKLCNGPYETISVDVLAKKFGWKCNSCGITCVKSRGVNERNEATIDHVIPVSKGGVHNWSNVQLLCRMCNSIKSDELPESTQLQLSLV